MKKIFLTLICFLFISPVNAENSWDGYSGNYNISQDELFAKTFDAIIENGYKIKEIQSESGYVLFKAPEGEYVLEVFREDTGSGIKITPITNAQNNLQAKDNIFKSLNNALGISLKGVQ